MSQQKHFTDLEPGCVVVGVDGSASALRAVELAAEQAQRQGRPLRVLHAATKSETEAYVWADLYAPAPYRFLGSAYPSGVVVADAVAVARHARPGVDVAGLAVDGEPREVLTSATWACELLVVGSRGRGPARSALLGSVSAAVARTAACPVIVSRPARPGSVAGGVVVGADLTAESLPVIEFAFRQASMSNAALTILHCFWSDLDSPVAEEEVQRRRMLLAESVAGFAEQFPDVAVTRKIAQGPLDRCLTEESWRPWELIVVGRRPRSGLAARLGGTHATAVLERAECPVAVVPQPAFRRQPVPRRKQGAHHA